MGADEQTGQRYTEDEVRAILERALRHDQARRVSHEELVAAAEEIGIPRAAIEAAARDLEGSRGEAEVRAELLARRRKGFRSHLFTFTVVNAFLFLVNVLTPSPWWFFWPLLAWGLGLAFHARGALSTEVSPRAVRRELERTAQRERKERRRLEKEAREAARRARKERLEQSAQELGSAVQEGVASLLSSIAAEIRPGAAPAEPPRPGRRIEPQPRARVDAAGAEDADAEALAEDEAARAAERGRGRR